MYDPNTAMPLPLVDGEVLTIDNSSLSTFEQCSRQSQYLLIHRREKNIERVPLVFGRIMHEALEVRYRSPKRMADEDLTQDMVNNLVEAFTLWSPPDGDFRNLEQAAECMVRYNKHYPIEPFTVCTVDNCNDDNKAVELPFCLPLMELPINQDVNILNLTDGTTQIKHIKTLPILWTGRIDLLIRDGDDNHFVFDHKTSSQGGATIFDEYVNSNQFKGYVWAGQKLITHPIIGAYVNILVNRKPNKQGFSIDFLRQPVYYSPEQIVEWEQNVMHMISDFLHNYLRGYFPMQTIWCKGKFGRCQFFDICSMRTDPQRQIMIDSPEYRDWTWNPVDQDESAVVNEAKPYIP